MARTVDPLVVGKVIGDVMDMFMPSVRFVVHYGPKQVTNGCDIKPSITVHPPNVQIAGHPDNLFTIVMTDPDAPSPSEPSMREWVHWIVTNIPGGSDPSQGREILPYIAPRPPIGIHRFIFVLFKQQTPLSLVAHPLPSTRANFSTRAFAAHNGLGLPVAAVYFNAQKEPANKKR
ncbi:protein MOTHER of FT and TFL1 [Amborella trichopoda]|uniref:MFT-like protein n=1 Tax=Amborella trichopoda TaxID=13333 RepID=W1PUF0_AMBTC|nr:protein MOTHER of FT and TFL1 [Amborella trichopoda]ERN11326.1 hypothetical protein AMTR_s00024p00249400 [Amborella trichopoda]|eukprot:XP_006849745.1 protein MOTHER of FT and TFL1 [Amborella trichopoda]